MDPELWITELARWRDERLAPLLAVEAPGTGGAVEQSIKLLRVALVNELNVTELASAWIPTTRELDVKLAFARQAGDEASHFRLIASRLATFGVDLEAFVPTDASPLFLYMHALDSTVARVAAGLFTLEAIAFSVNERFIDLSVALGDAETARIYRAYIQPDEQVHRDLGHALLRKYAITDAQRAEARATIARVAEIAVETRAAAAARLGLACLPGC